MKVDGEAVETAAAQFGDHFGHVAIQQKFGDTFGADPRGQHDAIGSWPE